MTRHALTHGPDVPRMEDDEEETTHVRAPIVESKADRLNPEMEYEVLELGGCKGDTLKDKLNELGKDGWVLVSTEPAFIFRRIKKPEEAKKPSRVGFSIG